MGGNHQKGCYMKLGKFLEEYLPLKGNLKVPTDEVLSNYREQYKKARNKPTIKFYKFAGSKSIYAHVLVPSGSVQKLKYDVILEFTNMGKTMPDCDVRIFSNAPSFVYNYAYVFYNMTDEGSTGMIVDKFDKKIPSKNMMVNFTEDLIDELPLHQNPKIRNPHNLPYFDKTIYFAIFALEEKYNKSSKIAGEARFERFDRFYKNIDDFETKMKVREKLVAEETKRKLADKINLHGGGSTRLKGIVNREIDKGNNVRVNKSLNVSVTPSNNVRRVEARTSKSVRSIRANSSKAVRTINPKGGKNQ
jgi:hypothetical protein